MATTRRLVLLALAALASAQYGYSGGYGGGSDGGDYDSGSNPFSGGGDDSDGGSSDFNGGFSGASQSLGFDPTTAEHIRLAHGVLAATAFVFFFPAGAISIRVIPHRAAIWIHAAFQVFAFVLYTVAFALGVWMVTKIKFPGFNMLTNPSTNYHPIIGIVIFALLLPQPVLGVLHHLAFRKHSRRVLWSHAHIWLGRLLITLGIINGGLGLGLSRGGGGGGDGGDGAPSNAGVIAYGVFAGLVWLVWMAAAVYGEVKRARAGAGARSGGGGGGRGRRRGRSAVYRPAKREDDEEEEGDGSDGRGNVAGVDGAAVRAEAHAPPMEEPPKYR